MNPMQAQSSADIRERSWHIVTLAPSNGAPALAYTVGLSLTFKHPEVAVLGLPSNAAYLLLHVTATAIEQGMRFSPGGRSSGLPDGYDFAFVTFPETQCLRYRGLALNYYTGQNLRALQLVWPDAHGRFPWEDGVQELVRVAQAVDP